MKEILIIMVLLAIVYKCQLRQKVLKINFISSRLIVPRNYTVYKQYACYYSHLARWCQIPHRTVPKFMIINKEKQLIFLREEAWQHERNHYCINYPK